MKPKIIIPCIIAVLVILVGILIIYRIIQFCQRHFSDPLPEPTPDPTNVVGAAWFIQALHPQSKQQSRVGATEVVPCDCGCFFTFTVMLVDGQLCLTNCFVPGSESETTFRQQLGQLGIDPNVMSHPDSIQQVNGVVTVYGAAPLITVVIERSSDLQTWLPVQTNAFPADRQLQTTLDGPCSNSFFRAIKL